jgi:hypothetical protein
MTWARRAIVPRPNVGAGVARISSRPLTRERSICSATQALQFKRGQRKRLLTIGVPSRSTGSSEGETKMNQVQQVQVVSIFTIEIDGNPTLAFEAKNMTEARGLWKEQWLLDDLGTLSSGGSAFAALAQS